MNKEQFRFSVFNMINYLINSSVSLYADLKDAQAAADEYRLELIKGQIMGLNSSFEKTMNFLIDEQFVTEEENEENLLNVVSNEEIVEES